MSISGERAKQVRRQSILGLGCSAQQGWGNALLAWCIGGSCTVLQTATQTRDHDPMQGPVQHIARHAGCCAVSNGVPAASCEHCLPHHRAQRIMTGGPAHSGNMLRILNSFRN
jgi:hypothetical protein